VSVYIDTVKNTTIASAPNLTAEGVVLTATDTPENCCILDNILVLTTSESWTMRAEFTPTVRGVADYFTIMGTSNDRSDGIYAIQVAPGKVRIYMNGECETNADFSLDLNVRHTFELVSDGSGTLTATVDDTTVSIELPTTHNGVACNCNVIGQSFFNGGNMNHAGIVHSLVIS